MSDTLKVCGLTIERGTKLRTYLPVPDTNVKIPLTIINGEKMAPPCLLPQVSTAVNIPVSQQQWS